jgi:hypothetical protein
MLSPPNNASLIARSSAICHGRTTCDPVADPQVLADRNPPFQQRIDLLQNRRRIEHNARTDDIHHPLVEDAAGNGAICRLDRPRPRYGPHSSHLGTAPRCQTGKSAGRRSSLLLHRPTANRSRRLQPIRFSPPAWTPPNDRMSTDCWCDQRSLPLESLRLIKQLSRCWANT